MEFPDNNNIDKWLKDHGDLAVKKLTERNLSIAEKVNVLLKERNITKADFAQRLGKSPSEVSKWLSGQHNLTMKSITKMEVVLGVDIIDIQSIDRHKIKKLKIRS